jgi:hypothetical protein
MALTKTISRAKEHDFDRIWEDAYLYILNIVYNKEFAVITLALCANQGEPPFDYLEYKFFPDVTTGSVNFAQQAYEYLKTLPEFSDATDC